MRSPAREIKVTTSTTRRAEAGCCRCRCRGSKCNGREGAGSRAVAVSRVRFILMVSSPRRIPSRRSFNDEGSSSRSTLERVVTIGANSGKRWPKMLSP